MSEPIRKSDIQQGDIFGQLAKEIREASDELKKYDEQLKKIAGTYQNDLSKSEKVTIANLQKLNDLNEKSQKLTKEKQNNVKNLTVVEQERLKLEKAIAKEQAAVTLATSKENKELQKLRAEKNRINKATRDEIKEVERSKNAYHKLTGETNKAQAQFKKLAAQYGLNDKRTKSARREFEKLDNRLRKINDAARDGRRDVGRYGKALEGLRGTAMRAATMFGAGFGAATITRSTIGTIVQYEQAQTDLAAITGKTSKELEGLSKQARELGATTQFSATEVTQLQIELAKLGFTSQEIMDSTGGIANFAAATGVEIPRAAALAGSALRAFGLDATEIDRVVSTLGVATTKSALDFSKLEAGLSTVAPVAASFGFSIEDTTALLGQLSNAGFDASSAATATRNILLNLADTNGDLAKQLGRPIKSADDLAAGLQELQAKGIDLAEALELTDKRSVAAFSTFIENSDTLVGLRDSITDVNDELTDMADKRLDSVSGQLQILKSAWEEQILGLNGATGASEKLKASISFLAENLGSIIRLIIRLIRFYAIWKVSTSKLGKSFGELSKALVKSNFNIVKLIKSLKSGKSGMEGAGKAARSFGKALKSIGFALAIDFALEFALALYDIASGAAEARKQQALFDAALERANENISAAAEKAREDFDERLRQIDIENRKRIAAAKERGASAKEIADLEKQLAKEGAEAEAQAAQDSVASITAKEEQKRAALAQTLKLLEQAEAARGTLEVSILGGISSSPEMNKLVKDLNELGYSADNFSEALRILNARESRLTKEVVGLNKAKKEFLKTLEEEELQVRETTIEIADNTDKLSKYTPIARDATEANEDLFDSYVNIGDVLREINEDNEKLKEQAFRESNETIDKELAERLTILTDQLRNEQITQEAFDYLRLEAELQALQERKELLIAFGEDVTDINLQIAEKQLEITQSLNDETVENAKDAQNELFDTVNKVQRNITNLIEEQTDKRIAALQKEVDAQRALRDQLTALAAEGNIEAQQSIKATIEAEREKEAEIARLEARKQKVQLISQGLETYLSLLESGESPGSAFAQTVITTQGLISFLSGLQGFWTGTDNAPEGLAWTQEKGAEIITDKDGKIKSFGSDGGAQLTYLQKGDKVKTASETANIFRAFNELENMRSIPKLDNAGNSYDLMTLGSKLDRIEGAIKNQPHSHTNWEEITRGLAAINNTTVKGGDKVINRHYVKR